MYPRSLRQVTVVITFALLFCDTINRYTIEVTHGRFVWTVKRRYKHFLHLHQQLKLSLSFQLSMNSMRFFDKKRFKLKNESLPPFSHRLDALISEQDIEQRSVG